MPKIVDYAEVLEAMAARGFASLYHNSGAFGFPDSVEVRTLGVIAAEDPTIRPAARQFVRVEADPVLQFKDIDAEAWLMPKSHWHYELHFGNRELLESVLEELGIDPALLRDRNDGSAIAFSCSERQLLRETVKRLLDGLRGSDFLVAWPEAGTLCTIHHHKQLWWQSTQSIQSSSSTDETTG